MLRRSFPAALLLLVAVLASQARTIQIDSGVAPYEKTSGISGSAGSIGSDTMNNLMALWLEGFRRYYPSVTIQIEGKGSSTAPPALIAGTAQFAPMSRAMKPTEVDKFEAKYGYEPTPLRTSLDAVALFVNKDNPVAGLSLAQIDAIFSKTRRGGFAHDISSWGQLGLRGPWARAPISLYGRNSASGTYGYFKKVALSEGDYKDTVKQQPGSASVVQGVTEELGAIGYSGIGYRTSGVRVVPLAGEEGPPFRYGTYENVLDGAYPLGRYLYLYINRRPGQPLDPMIREFCRFVFSREGQEIVVKDGYMPVPLETLREELAKIGTAFSR